ncbi:spore germination protein [Pseudoneobacillus sp. C159]
MFFKKKSSAFKQRKTEVQKNENHNPIPTSKESMSKEFKNGLQNSADIIESDVLGSGITLFYLNTMIDKKMLHENIIDPIKQNACQTIEEMMEYISVGQVDKSNGLDAAIKGTLDGVVIIHVEGEAAVLLAKAPSDIGRSLSTALNESQVVGPQIAFNESLMTNISLIRKYISDPNLSVENFQIGKRSHTTVSMIHINGIASEGMVDILRERIQSIEIDGLIDSSILEQLLEDNSYSIFPLMVLTERPDRICDWLLKGKLCVLVDGSSLAIACPQSFLEFFESMEDSDVNWQVASFLRLLRIIALFLSVFFTAIYVAALTFHYEVIPQTLLIPLSESRSKVPFPPLIEALLMEMIIELLREAGARLPTKVGQTIGIVGGIVIGTAAVDAGFTSNILIIIVALGALASFATPNFSMGNTIRILRFPIMLLAGFLGFYGIMFSFCFLLIHLLKQSSLGVPFLTPFYPPRLADWKDSIIRLPYSFTNKRPTQTRPEDPDRYDSEKAKKQD